MQAAETLGETVGLPRACASLAVSRATLYRRRARQAQADVAPSPRPAPPLKLSAAEQAEALAYLHSERFCDATPYTVHATLLDEGVYVGSVRTLYRLLEGEGEVRERRRVLDHPAYTKPQLLATAPNQLWSWDITKLKGPTTWTYFYLYVILDVFSRCVVGWMVATRESATLATRLIAETCAKQHIAPEQLTIHADRGPSMTSKAVAYLLADLGVTKTHSRPYTSDDNPFSEAQFKTLKYRPDFPERFGSLQDARAYCRTFFDWYNHEHRHGGIAYLTPQSLHDGQGALILAGRHATMQAAFDRNPQRFKHQPPALPQLPSAVWINPPEALANINNDSDEQV
jgi:transposase InsO family protein